jgi:YHS domain-containing protein
MLCKELIYVCSLLMSEGKLMPRDPVCGVILNEKTAKYKITHDGETYYFCSVKCKKKFKRNRSKFADK